MKRFVLRLLCEEHGQDLVEYALLTGVIGFAGIAVFDVILGAINNTYGSQETAVNNLWESPAPGSGGPVAGS